MYNEVVFYITMLLIEYYGQYIFIFYNPCGLWCLLYILPYNYIHLDYIPSINDICRFDK